MDESSESFPCRPAQSACHFFLLNKIGSFALPAENRWHEHEGIIHKVDEGEGTFA